MHYIPVAPPPPPPTTAIFRNFKKSTALCKVHNMGLRYLKNWLSSKDKCKPVLLGLSLAGNLVRPLLSLYETEWREHLAMDSEHCMGHPSIGYKIR